MTLPPHCKLIQCALFQETAWAISHATRPEVGSYKKYKYRKLHPCVNEDTWQFELQVGAEPCEWSDIIEDEVIFP